MPRAAATKTAPQSQAPAPKPAANVTVACKIPTGVVLQLCAKEEYTEEGLNGSRARVRYTKVGQTFIARGPASPNGQVPRGYVRPAVAGGYALTSNIPADFWDAWLEQNKDNPIVVNQMIMAYGKRATTIGEARDRKDLMSGFEPMNPDGDPRNPKPLLGQVSQVATADEMAERQQLPDAGDEEVFED